MVGAGPWPQIFREIVFFVFGGSDTKLQEKRSDLMMIISKYTRSLQVKTMMCSVDVVSCCLLAQVCIVG